MLPLAEGYWNKVAASRAGSKIHIINEPIEGSSVFLVETGESRTPRSRLVNLPGLLASLLDQLTTLGETAAQIKKALREGNSWKDMRF
ncbi:MAG: hypothetical protein A2144_13495 [Chloroflexi bacterium RBG_16_50_9]|nr:MAG: hypothetical protein A2144_13495 [Chloroflexi bacterium RBG_16_50_9]